MLRNRKNKSKAEEDKDEWIKAAKQDPLAKRERAKHSDGKVYFSYAQIHRTICSLVPRIKEFRPDIILAIGNVMQYNVI